MSIAPFDIEYMSDDQIPQIDFQGVNTRMSALFKKENNDNTNRQS